MLLAAKAPLNFIIKLTKEVVKFCLRNYIGCMYVCIEVALRGDAHGIGHSNWAKGRDPSGLWVQYPNPAGPTAPRHSRWIILMH